MDFKEMNIPISLHFLNTMGLGPLQFFGYIKAEMIRYIPLETHPYFYLDMRQSVFILSWI